MKVTEVILVDEKDRPVGTAEKMEAHQKGLLHRAFSVFVFNAEGEMLLQQRAMSKYHSAGLWSNACCSHPLPGEETQKAAQRRIQEELGITPPVKKIFDFTYRTRFDDGLIEHEFDHVFIAGHNGAVPFNRDEVMSICYKEMKEIVTSLKEHPQQYTTWFHLAFPKVQEWWKHNYNKEK